LIMQYMNSTAENITDFCS